MFEPLEDACQIKRYRISKIYDEKTGQDIATPAHIVIDENTGKITLSDFTKVIKGYGIWVQVSTGTSSATQVWSDDTFKAIRL